MSKGNERTLFQLAEYARLQWWTRTGVCLIGIVFLGISLPPLIERAATLIFESVSDLYDSRSVWGRLFGYLQWSIGDIIQVIFGYICIFHARPITNWLTRGLVDHCWHCGYSLKDIRGAVCPECGSPIANNAASNSSQIETSSASDD